MAFRAPGYVPPPNLVVDTSGFANAIDGFGNALAQRRDRDTMEAIGQAASTGGLNALARAAYGSGKINLGLQATNALDQRVARAASAKRVADQEAESRRRFDARLDLDRSNAARAGNLTDARVGLIKSQTGLTDAKRRDVALRGTSRNRQDFLKMYKVLEDAQTPEQWHAAQPMLQRVFGELVPFERRGFVLAQMTPYATSADRYAPTDEEAKLGISRDVKRDAALQKKLRSMYGKPKVGHIWAIGPDGKPTQRLMNPRSGAKWQSEKEKGSAIIANSIRNIDRAARTMLSTSSAGRAIASGLEETAAGRFAMSVVGGEETAQAFKDYEQGVLMAVYEMSGKQTTNAEMERFLGAYMPRGGDSAKRIRMKTKRIKSMLRAIEGHVSSGKPYDEAESLALSSPGMQRQQRRQEIQNRFQKYGVE